MQDLGPAAVIVLITPFDVLRSDRRAVVKLDPPTQLEGGALGVFGKLKMLSKRQVIVQLLAKVLDQRILQHVEEIVSRGTAIVLLRVEPARRNVGVPGQHHFAACGPVPGRPGATHERRGQRGRRHRRPQHAASAELRVIHDFLPYRCREACGWALAGPFNAFSH